MGTPSLVSATGIGITFLILLIGCASSNTDKLDVCENFLVPSAVLEISTERPVRLDFSLEAKENRILNQFFMWKNEKEWERVRDFHSMLISSGKYILLSARGAHLDCKMQVAKDWALSMMCQEAYGQSNGNVPTFSVTQEHSIVANVSEILSIGAIHEHEPNVLAFCIYSSTQQEKIAPVDVQKENDVGSNEGKDVHDTRVLLKQKDKFEYIGHQKYLKSNEYDVDQSIVTGKPEDIFPAQNRAVNERDGGNEVETASRTPKYQQTETVPRSIVYTATSEYKGTETLAKTQMITNSEKYQQTETDAKTPMVTESDKYQVTETLEKTQMITNSEKYQQTETDAKTPMATESDKYQVTETLEKTQMITNSEKYQQTETDAKTPMGTQSEKYQETETLAKTPLRTESNTYIETETIARTPMGTATNTYKETETLAKTPLRTESNTYIETETIAKTPMGTATNTYKETETLAKTPLRTESNTYIETETIAKTPMGTATNTYKETETLAKTPENTNTNTISNTISNTMTNTQTNSNTGTENLESKSASRSQPPTFTKSEIHTASHSATQANPEAPIILSISPAFGGVGGGLLVTITGLNFGDSTSERFVRIGTNNCLNPQFLSSKSVTCTTPPSGVGKNKVYVVVDGMAGTSEIIFEYMTPVISDINPKLLPVDSADSSKRVITITGQHLLALNAVSSYLTYVGDENCNDVRVLSDNGFTCTAPAGVGKNIVVKASINLVNVTTPNGEPLTVDRTPPTISTINPPSGLISGGYNLTLLGHSFGYTKLGGTFSVAIGNQLVASSNIMYRSNFALIIKVPEGSQVGTFPLAVNVAGQSLSSASKNYSYRPEIHSIEPTFGQSGGGTTITVYGPNFSTDTQVYINGVQCGSTSLLNSKSIKCVTPPGHGTLVNVYASTGSLQSPSYALWTYKDPVIESIQPSVGVAAGGTLVTIQGMYLGSILTDKTAVTINGVKSEIVYQSDTVLIIKTPAGLGSSLPLVVNTGVFSSNAFTWSYLPPEITANLSPQRSSLIGLVPVSIIGKNFGAYQYDQVARIDEVPCAPTVWVDDSLIVCHVSSRLTPSSNLKVTVTVAGTTSTINQFSNFEYYSTGIISIQPSSSPITGGFEITIVMENESSTSLNIDVTDKMGKKLTGKASRKSKNTYVFRVSSLSAANQLAIGDAVISVSTTAKTYEAGPYYFYGSVKTTGIQPSRGHYQAASPITISGSGFSPKLYSSMSLYISPDDTIPVWFTIINENTLFAFTPKNHLPGKYSVFLKLGQTVAASPVSFSFYTNPIAIASAKYSSDFTNILLTFEKETNRGEFAPGKSECRYFLDSSTLAIVGESATCSWSDYSTLVIYPSVSPSIGFLITIANDTIVAKGKYLESRDIYPSSSGSIAISAKDEKTYPVALAVGNVFGRCSSLFLDASYSYGGKALLQYQWEFLYSEPNYDSLELSALISTKTTPIVMISPEENDIIGGLPFNTTYVFRVTVTNAYGLSNSTIIQASRLDNDLPMLSVSLPFVSSITSHLPVAFTANVFSDICKNTDFYSPKFSWNISTSTSDRLSDYGILSSESRQRKLNFKENAFAKSMGDSVKLTVSITDVSTSQQSSNTIEFTVIERPFYVSIIGGNRTSGTSDKVNLAADVIYYNQFPSDFLYEWTCSDSNGNPCGIVLSNDSNLVIESGQLLQGTYYFSVTVSKSQSSCTGYAFLVYQPGTTPVSTISVSPSLDSIVTGSYIRISSSSKATSGKDSKFTYSWSVTDDYIDLNSESVVMKSDGSGFTILPGKLKARVPYQFILKTTDQTGNSGKSFITITPNGPPTGGSFTVTPSTGTALKTKFSLSATNWEDKMENTPLSYAFYYFDATSPTPVLIMKSNMHYSQALLPSGNLTIICEISNRLGEKSKVSTNVQVQQIENVTGEDLVAKVNEAFSSSDDFYFQIYFSNIFLQEISRSYVQTALSTGSVSMSTLLGTVSKNTYLLWANVAKLPDTVNSVSSVSKYLFDFLNYIQTKETLDSVIALTDKAIKTISNLEASDFDVSTDIYKNFYTAIEQVASYYQPNPSRRSSETDSRTTANKFVLESLENIGLAEAYQTICGHKTQNKTASQYTRFLFNALETQKSTQLATNKFVLDVQQSGNNLDCLVGWVGWTSLENYVNASQIISANNPRSLSTLLSARFYSRNDTTNSLDALNPTQRATSFQYTLRVASKIDEESETPLCIHWGSTDTSEFSNTTCKASYDAFSKHVSCKCSASGYVSVYAVDKVSRKVRHETSDFYPTPLILGVIIPAFLMGLVLLAVINTPKPLGRRKFWVDNGTTLTFFDSSSDEWAVYSKTAK